MAFKWIQNFLARNLPQDDGLTPSTDNGEPLQVAARMTPQRIFAAIDAAECGDTRELFVIYRDAVLSSSHAQGEFAKRKLAVLNQPLTVLPWDKAQPADVAAANRFYRSLDTTPRWLHALAHLMDSALWPVAVAEKVFRADGAGFKLDRLVPVPHHLLDFTEGTLRIRDVDADGRPVGTFHDCDPNRYIVHRGHLLSMPDKLGGPMRSILFWWLFASQGRDWWMTFLRQYGGPFMIGKYPRGDEVSRRLMQRIISFSQRLRGAAIPHDAALEIKEALLGDGDAFEKLHLFANRQISQLIVGQTLSSEAQATGMGSGVAKTQDDVRSDIKQMDAALLSQTLRDQLLLQLHQINGASGSAPYLIFGSPSDSREMLELMKALYAAGLTPAASALEKIGELCGFEVERQSAPALGALSADTRPALRAVLAALAAAPQR